jgi:hypothetical protein
MKKDFKINPIGLKGNEINERMKQLMGITPINENVSRSVVELTKMGPDGKAYAIVRENHEYYIKVSNKTSKLVTEDFNYIGGLQNKKKEAYPSYAKATKHLNLTFKSLAEAYGTDSNINVFEDDDLLNEENFATKHIVDKNGHELKQDAKEGSEDDGFGDNLANGKTKSDFEKPKKLDEGWAGFAEMTGNGFMEEGMFGDDIEMSEEEQYIDKMLEDNGNDFYRTDAEDQIPNPPSQLDIPVDEELHGNQYKLDLNRNGKLDKDDFSKLRNNEGYMEEDMYEEGMYQEGMYQEGMYEEGYMEEDMYGNQDTENVSTDELMDKLDNMSASELIAMLGDAGRDLKNVVAQKLSSGMDKARNYFDKQYPNEGMGRMHGLEEEEMSSKDKEFAALAEPKDKITYADKIAGATKDENITLEEIQEAIADLKKKL